MFATSARPLEEEWELAVLAREDIGVDEAYRNTFMQGAAYILSKARHI